MASDDLRERVEAHADLLRVYGDVREQPTEKELWAGCKDAAPLLRECVARIAALERRLAEAGAAGRSQADRATHYRGEAEKLVARAERAERERDDYMGRYETSHASRLHAEAALERAERERDENERAREMHARINERVAEALGQERGESWHDLPEKVAVAASIADEALASLAKAERERDELEARLDVRGDQADEYREQRDEARAEVERLRKELGR